MKGLKTDLVGQGWRDKGSGTLPSPLLGAVPPASLPSHRDGSGVAVRKCTQGWEGSRGSTDTMLAVVRKPPESMQMPLSLSLRMPIITSAVIPPAKEDTVRAPRGQKGALRPQRKPPEAVGGKRAGPPADHSPTTRWSTH